MCILEDQSNSNPTYAHKIYMDKNQSCRLGAATELTGAYLLIISLIIGPLIVGSYFGFWRWPVIVTSSIASLLLIASYRPHHIHSKWLAIVIIWPIIQGIWMWYNAWGEFHRLPDYESGQLPWQLLELENQAFPLLPGTADKAEALDKLGYIIPCLGLFWGTRQLVISRPSWCQNIASTIFWTGASVALLGLIQRGTGAEGIFWNETLNFKKSPLFFGTYRSPGIATCFLNVSLAFGLSSILTVFRKTPKNSNHKNNRRLIHSLGTAAGVIIITCGLITAGSKAGMALGVFTILLWATMNRRSITTAFKQSSNLFQGRRRTERNIVVTALILITALSLLSLAGVVSDRWQTAHNQDYSTLTGRMHANQVIIKMISDDGWGIMGCGPGSFYPLFPFYTDVQNPNIRGIWVYAHNDYLQTLLEWGWLGTICFTTIIGGAIFLLSREIFFRRNHHSKTRFIYLRGYLIAMVTFLVHASVDFPFQIESLAIIFFVMAGVAWSVVDLRDRDIRNRHHKRSSQSSTS